MIGGSVNLVAEVGILLMVHSSFFIVAMEVGSGSDSCKLPPVSSKFSCPTYSNEKFSIPSISEEEAFNYNISTIPYHLTKTTPGITYVFRTGVQENCLKPVSQLKFCYMYKNTNPDLEDKPKYIFGILSLNPMIDQGSLLFSKVSAETVRREEISNHCSLLYESREMLCCETFFPSNFYLSSFVGVSAERGSHLLMYNDLTQNREFRIPQYIIGSNLDGILSSDFCTGTAIESKGLLILKFFFDNSTCLGTCKSGTEVIVPVDYTATLAGADGELPLLPIVMGSSAAALVAIMTTLVIIAVCCFIVRRYRRSSVPVLETHFSNAFDNSIYGIEQLDRVELCPTSQPKDAESAYDEVDDTGKASYFTLKPSSQDEEEDYFLPAKDEQGLYSQLQNMTIVPNRSSVKLGDLLGSGQFGAVYRGTLSRRGSEADVDVAVKTLKERASYEDKVKFLQEAAIMGQFKHPNIVNMYGIVTDGEPMLLILELLNNGDLRKHLLASKQKEGGSSFVDGHSLLSYCRQVAAGMVYLSNKRFVHRDLAARNILVSEDDTCKISDFGMSRDLADESYYTSQGGKIPVKWTAPEALYYKKYSTSSDVWSYGVVMYEIWSLGHQPFEELNNSEVIKLLDTGYRLAPPPGCPRYVYGIMISCWHPDPSKRATFESVSQQICMSDTKLLQWTEEDLSVHPLVDKLGGKLDSKNLYKDLQESYKE